MGDSSFNDLYHILFQLSSVHNKPISHFIQLEDFSFSSSLSWDSYLWRDLRDEEVYELSSLLGYLERVRLVEEVDDIRVWDMDLSCVFSLKSLILIRVFLSDQ